MNLSSLFRKKSIDKILKDSTNESHFQLTKNLRLVDLTALAIAAIIGAGIFSTIGNASASGGPAVSVLFIFTALACAFSAMCYADFASRIPISGSAYTYTYASLGELFAWIIGWDLLMEYSIGNIAVAISWSDYFTSFIEGFGYHIPDYLTTDYLSASRGFSEAETLLHNGTALSDLPYNLLNAYQAWVSAPSIFGLRIIADIPAFSIVAMISALIYRGIRESKIAGNIMVLLKLAVVLVVIAVGSFYVKPENWHPFAPNGLAGVLKGVSAVFFAYIGFDAISTTAEECKNPRRDLPKAMIISLVVCTILYVLITLVLTGMVNYKDLAVGDPLAFVFEKVDLPWISGLVAFSAIIAMASVLLVFQVGQPRIWMSMSRDGLLPKKFASIHPKYKTPGFSTIVTGFLVAVPSLFTNLTEMTDLTSIGTLFAFVLVCGGVLFLSTKKQENSGKFKIPYLNSKFFLPIIYAITFGILYYYQKDSIINFFTISSETLQWNVFQHKIPMLIFLITSIIIMYFSLTKNLSLIPVLGLLTNLYLMTELGITNWTRFLIWLVIGLVIYFAYSYKHSKLRN
ncbi:MAG: amino acid transporter [Bacteroidetes bacterium GWA2_31_9]|nr:MAG: amino acid transporter [Bacteroidetes bacterium GWA2_31_9]